MEREMRLELKARWREACERPALQLSHGMLVAGVMGPARYPLISDIEIGDQWTPTTFLVELRPGQVPEDLEDAGQELAGALFCHRLAFDPIPHSPYVRVTMIEDDPHAEVVTGVEVIAGTIALGPDEYGNTIRVRPVEMPHCAVQGTTGGGKSTALYWLMRQIVGMPGARLAGIDPSGVIFRPLPDDPWRVQGLADLHRIVDTLAELCAEMDARNRRMPWDDDKLPCGPGGSDPWLFVVLEELPGMLAALEAVDRKLAALARLYIGRLAAEGRKTGLRLVMAAQRFDANSTAGATVRGNCGLRVSFRVENRAAVEFLHEDAPPDTVAEHLHAAAGVALVSAPGHGLRRARLPHMTYREWAHFVRDVYGDRAAA